MRKLRPAAPSGPWSFLFGEIAVYAFVVLVVTGGFLMLFFEPSMASTVYAGSYTKLRGVAMSQAYSSTLHISFDVRGGLLVRQVHHWAALIFIAATSMQLLRMFFTGAFRRPRTRSWLIWVGLLVLGMAAGITGTVLPDDMLSGGSLSLIQGVVQSIPLVGTDLSYLIFGGGFPGTKIISLMYIAHVFVIPAVIVVLLAVRYRLLRQRGQAPFMAAMFFATCAVLTLLGTLVQINPIWLFGQFEPGSTTAGAVPGWYMGFLDGALRIMPNWEMTVFGHTLTLAVLVPALIVPGAFFVLLATYPVIERWLTGDSRPHELLDRPRDAAVRTAFGAAGVTFYGTLWAAAANDQIATHFHVSLFAVTWFFRIGVVVGPLLAFVLTHRICLGLQLRDRDEAVHGIETGIVVRRPDGGYFEVTKPVPDRNRQPLELPGKRPH